MFFRISKVKIPKSKIVERSRLKPVQWGKLDVEWTKFVDENFAASKKKRGRPAKNTDSQKDNNEMEVDSLAKTEDTKESQIEPYKDWKKRILSAAYKELEIARKQQIQMSKLSPRRSPRKTPQKASPYKSPSKAVRLLFPLNF
ncbi:unnamed protein product [Diatraea saccharalis]|uniref:Origin recognition complex subunit 6 n=1 Tax=Diatraea saccharalis TaxID=40085 RepID=A0A9N9RBF8_9NEOP|nr:unnamed protein product [Diatraea saccharalis]